MRPPAGRALTISDKTFYLEALLAAMWHYRFLHRDLEHLLEADPELAQRYQLFARRCLVAATGIYQGFVDAGILLMEAPQIEALTLNSWIILTSWVRFLSTARGDHLDISEAQLRRGIYQVLALESGFLSPAARPALQALHDKLYVPLDQVL